MKFKLIVLLIMFFFNKSIALKPGGRTEYWYNYTGVNNIYFFKDKLGASININSEYLFVIKRRIDVWGIGANFSVLTYDNHFNSLIKLYLNVGKYHRENTEGVHHLNTKYCAEIGFCYLNNLKTEREINKIAPFISFCFYRSFIPNINHLFIYPKISFSYGKNYKLIEIGLNIGFRKRTRVQRD